MVFGLASCCSLVAWWPLLKNIEGQLPSLSDGSLIAFLIYHASQFWLGNTELAAVPFSFPDSMVGTFSDPYLTLGWVALCLRPLGLGLVGQHNALLALSSLLSLLAFFLLANKLVKSAASAWLGAIWFTFSPLRMEFITHAHTHWIWGLPLVIYAWIKFAESQKNRWLIICSLIFWLQVINSPFTGLLLLSAILGWMLWATGFKKSWALLKRRVGLIAFLSMITCLILWWVYRPYVESANLYQSFRSIRDAAHFSYSLERLINWDYAIFMVAGIWWYLFRRSVKKSGALQSIQFPSKVLVAISGFGLINSLGPVLKIADETIKIWSIPLPLPFSLFYYVIPGMNAFRAVTRWEILVLFGMGLAGAYWLATVRLNRLQKTLFAAVFTLIWVSYSYINLPHYLLPPSSHLYMSLAKLPSGALIELPEYVWPMGKIHDRENLRLIYQPVHQKPLFNGQSGFIPHQKQIDILSLITDFPSRQSLDRLRDLKIRYVLIHFDEYQTQAGLQFENHVFVPITEIKHKINQLPDLTLIECDSTACLYEIK